VTPETIRRLRSGVFPSYVLRAGFQLDVFTPLKDGALTVEQIASAIDVDPDRLKPLLYSLVVVGLLELGGDRFSNTPEADRFLVRGRPQFMGHSLRFSFFMWEAISKTVESIRTGVPQAKFDYTSLSEEVSEFFYQIHHKDAIKTGKALMEKYDFSSCRRLVDVGGGTGGLAITVAEAFPMIEATVIDLPSVTPTTKRFIDEAGVSDRVKVVSADAVRDSLMGSYDVAVLKDLIQVLPRDEVRLVLRNVVDLIESGGQIFVIGQILDDSCLSPLSVVMYSLAFLNAYESGRAYTEREYRDWLEEAGFEDFQKDSLPSGECILVAKKRCNQVRDRDR